MLLWTVVLRDAALVSAIALLLRVPFTSTMLWGWDSVLYARAIDDFHLGSTALEQRPQPPGYVLYVALARVASAIAGDHNAALVAVSVVAGALACGVAVLLGAWLAGRRAGLFAGAVAMANPVLWHGSEIAYPYALLGLLAGALGLAFLRIRSPRATLLASAAFGLALGARQDLAVLLGPLWLVLLWSQSRRVALRAVASAGACALVWFVPSAVAAGGADRYLTLVVGQALSVSAPHAPSSPPLARNFHLTVVGLYAQLQWLWPVAGLGFARLALTRATRPFAARLIVWLLPALALYLFVHIGEHGYTLALAIPLAALVGVGADAVPRLAPGRLTRLAVGAPALATLMLGATFVFGGLRFSATAIQRHDLILREQVAYITAHLDPAKTLVLAVPNYWHARYYLPQYQSLLLPTAIERGTARRHHVFRGYAYAVFFDDEWLRFRRTAMEYVALPGRVDLYYVQLRGAAVLVQNGDELTVTTE